MVGIYKYANGLQFTGMVAKSRKKAVEHLFNQFLAKQPASRRDWYSVKAFEKEIMPHTFEIKEIEMV